MTESLDCCHSGSGTRKKEVPEFKSRQANFIQGMTRWEAQSQDGFRDLENYVGGYYAQQWEKRQKLEVPLSTHVLLSACESVQQAADTPTGGAFTSGLIAALEHAKGQINYSDLYLRTHAAVQKIRWIEQTPQFETIGGFYPYVKFLGGEELGRPDRYEVLHEKGKWYVKCGAIHGLPIQSAQPCPDR